MHPTPAQAQETGSLRWSFRAWNGSRFGDAPVETRADRLTVWLSTAWEPQIVSLETMHATGAFRARSGTEPPDSAARPLLSSLIVLDGAGDEPRSLEQAVEQMLPVTTVRRDQPVSMYWEVYSDSGFAARTELAAVPLSRVGVLGRMIGRRAAPASRVRWTQSVDPVLGVFRRSVGLAIDQLPAGPYEISVSVSLEDGTSARTSTRIVLVD